MKEAGFSEVIRDETNRALWEIENVVACVPDDLWDRCYSGMPLWKHIYHMLHSLDQWYIDPMEYEQPSFHTEDLNDLDVPSGRRLSREEIAEYFRTVKKKIVAYDDSLTDEILLQKPERCEWDRFTLILAQHRHLHSHMGMIMGFLIRDADLWPRVLGLTRKIPDGEFGSVY